MAILLLAPGRDCSDIIEAARGLDPSIELRCWPDIGDPSEIDFAVTWRHPAGSLAHLPALKAVSSLGAGAEQLLSDPDLPSRLPIGRLAGPELARDMAFWLVAWISHCWQGLEQIRKQQAAREWLPVAPERPPTVGLLGMGCMGQAAARALQGLGADVRGWSLSGRGPDGVSMHHGQSGLATLAGQVDFLVCLLPLTPATRGLLDRHLFARMRPDAVLINAGRGEHLVEADLLEGLDRGRPGLAVLDVFEQEPLPPDHPFWAHPSIRISPHCAALSRPREVAELMLESYRRVQRGEAPLGLVDRERAY
ncbi:2-hydroxyacid dehydrogenase [Wenzhouxiangella marina]|uniref:Uncharacterized protein n=1 Tax=Wenzhouxiangella marina TaxID=1579979 RepID=A0A0K0XXG8_9GAMM|nr:glyoxylate/hydroxypyruvate reductase A [Wenzhouxiangella marina]AKS42327.1 hypothetical protein WM2015_1961 [Wenzhouxiangella marina]MBB6085900.1 glyoxylate/hydroxypyruvate reductase A [Wenzhouxiangella marina]